METKKGLALSQAFAAVLVVVLVAVIVIVSFVLFDALAATAPLQSRTILNEAGGYINTTGYTLDNATNCGFTSVAITQAINTTSGLVIGSGNYTVSGVGVVTNASNTAWNAVTFNYTFQDRGSTCEAAQNTSTQFATYPALIGLVGTIVFLGLVIGVLIGSFMFTGRRRV